jgi:transposase InsO family protein
LRGEASELDETVIRASQNSSTPKQNCAWPRAMNSDIPWISPHAMSTPFFVIRHAKREILHVGVTRYPTAEWAAQQIVECCACDRWPPRFLIHDRDSRYGMTFDNRLRRLGIKQIRTPYRSPRANAVVERWVKSARSECLDHLFIFSEAGLRRDLSTYVSYFNHWRPHRSIGQRTPRDPEGTRSPSQRKYGKIIADPVLGGLHHVYKLAA